MKTLKGDIDTEGIKRLYVEAEIVMPCPNCKKETSHNLGEQYLSHMVAGAADSAYFYCEECDEDWSIPIKLISATVEIEYNTNKIMEG